MKKYLSIIIAAIVTACVTSVFAQGTVIFNNGTGLVWRMSGPDDLTLVPMPKGGGEVQLFWAAAGTPYTPWSASLTGSAWYSANPGWSLGPVVGFTTPTAGKFTGGALTLSPLVAGGNIDYVVAGWTGNASSMDAALAGGSLVGVSSRFSSATGNPLAVPPGIPVPLSASFGGLILAVPEPSSLTLTALGASALVVLRRRAIH